MGRSYLHRHTYLSGETIVELSCPECDRKYIGEQATSKKLLKMHAKASHNIDYDRDCTDVHYYRKTCAMGKIDISVPSKEESMIMERLLQRK